MLMVPLQGTAAAYAPMQQTLDASTSMPCHEHAAPQPGDSHHGTGSATLQLLASEQGPATDAPRDADATSHLCCQLMFTCATATLAATSAHKFGDVVRSVLPLTTLFIPDSPDRPPRG